MACKRLPKTPIDTYDPKNLLDLTGYYPCTVTLPDGAAVERHVEHPRHSVLPYANLERQTIDERILIMASMTGPLRRIWAHLACWLAAHGGRFFLSGFAFRFPYMTTCGSSSPHWPASYWSSPHHRHHNGHDHNSETLAGETAIHERKIE